MSEKKSLYRRVCRNILAVLMCSIILAVSTPVQTRAYSSKLPYIKYEYWVYDNSVKMKIKNCSSKTMTVKSCRLVSQISKRYNMKLKLKTKNVKIKPGKRKTIYFTRVSGKNSHNLTTYEFRMKIKWKGKTLSFKEVAYDDLTGDVFCKINGSWKNVGY